MNSLSDDAKVCAYLRDTGWLSDEDPVRVERFPGGVSGFVWKIESSGRSWVLKQPLERLATEQEWISDTRRLDVEVAALRRVHEWYPDVVPEVLHHDPVAHVCLMSCAPDDAVSWKGLMMAGRFERATAAAAGSLLGDIHREAARAGDSVRTEFEDLTFFHELRVEPFHRFLIDRYPEIENPIEDLIFELVDRRTTLVHGDFSPKNLLVRPSGELILLDFEVTHWGNPVFDVAYCVGHLMLKGWAVGPPEEALACIESFLESYQSVPQESRLVPHLGLMLLARLDGKSTVDYVKDPLLKSRIRDVAFAWIRGESDDSAEAAETPMTSIRSALRN